MVRKFEARVLVQLRRSAALSGNFARGKIGYAADISVTAQRAEIIALITRCSGSDACLSSTRATKHDIDPLVVDALEQVLALQPVSFIYNEGDGRVRYGFIAEDTAGVDAHLATYDASSTISGIDDRAILSIVVKAIQSLAAKISETAHLVIDAVTARIGNFGRVNTDELCAKKSDGSFACVTGDELTALLSQPAAAAAPTSEPSSPSEIGEQPAAEDPPTSVSSTTPDLTNIGDEQAPDLTDSEHSPHENSTAEPQLAPPSPEAPIADQRPALAAPTIPAPEPANDNVPVDAPEPVGTPSSEPANDNVQSSETPSALEGTTSTGS